MLFDRIRNIGHAILAVYEPNEVLILDSLSNFITSHMRYRHYIPQYSMNETTRWAPAARTGNWRFFAPIPTSPASSRLPTS